MKYLNSICRYFGLYFWGPNATPKKKKKGSVFYIFSVLMGLPVGAGGYMVNGKKGVGLS